MNTINYSPPPPKAMPPKPRGRPHAPRLIAYRPIAYMVAPRPNVVESKDPLNRVPIGISWASIPSGIVNPCLLPVLYV